ncbi:hypothetical protein P7C71_g4416, partial [Lecanoromycetidae sp. Uapishka_2]
MTALVVWAQKVFNLAAPPKPKAYLTTSVESSGLDIEPFDVIYVDSTGVVPQGVVQVASNQSQNNYVDPNLWEIQDPAGGDPPPQPTPSNSVTQSSTSAQTQSAQLQSTGTPSAAQAQSSTSMATETTAAAYVKGTCSFHLTETQDCAPDAENLFAAISLKDGAGDDIGDIVADPTRGNIGVNINSTDGGYHFISKLPYPLVITGEHEHDYVQYNYGTLAWQSTTPNGGAYCNNGGWDPSEGPTCDLDETLDDRNAVRQMDCFFPC